MVREVQQHEDVGSHAAVWTFVLSGPRVIRGCQVCGEVELVDAATAGRDARVAAAAAARAARAEPV